jgi:uncharacterized membrane protein YraQ (UPF0718 family)
MLLFILGVAVTFWLVSRYPALGNKAAMSGMDAFNDPMTHEAHFAVDKKAPLHEKVFYTSLNWYETNWRGMVFGLLLAGAFLTLLSYLPRKTSGNRFLGSIQGMFVGTPLGVCVNCVAPIVKGMYEAGSRMETALAVMFSSPTLNIIVLTMLFSIFPFYMAVMKIAATFVLVLVIVPFISEKDRKPVDPEACAIPTTDVCELAPGTESWQGSIVGTAKDYWKNFSYLFIRTVPLMLLAGLLGAFMSHVWSFEKLIGVPVNFINLSLISFMGTFMPLPIVFDIMLAQALMMSGMASGFVMTMLFTLGTFSIYSASIITQTFSLRLAIKLYAIVFFMGIGLGYLANYYAEAQYTNWLAQYDKLAIEESAGNFQKIKTTTTTTQPQQAMVLHPTKGLHWEIVQDSDGIRITSSPHVSRKQNGDLPFTKILGPELGLEYSNVLTSKVFFDPLFFGRGIAGGDFNNDGWTDLAVATGNGFELYQNIDGKEFRKLVPAIERLTGLQTVSVALVDMNNDGRLDVFFTTFKDGNYIWLNPENQAKPGHLLEVPNNGSLLTSALGFADINRDASLDIVQGNYFLGVLTRKPIDKAVNQVLINKGLKFQSMLMTKDAGQTHSVLLSDINNDLQPDLLVGNDYLVSDTYYYGDDDGNFNKINKSQGIIPITTENTMSIDTGDFNNDLIPDIYLANIGFSKGIDVVSNIFGDFMQEAGQKFCSSTNTVLPLGECRELLKLVTLLNPEKQDISERCLALEQKDEVTECMVMRLALFAAKNKDASLCQRINERHPIALTYCQEFFQAKHLPFNREEEIPMRSFSNILLQGKSDSTFTDRSKASGTTTAEWSWNARFADFDNDEWQDLFVVNGVLITQEFASNNFFHNQKGEGFNSAEKSFGLEDFDHSSAYTLIDIENDGDLDIITNTLYGPFKIYLNNENKRNSIVFNLRDDRGNHYCIGCKVIIHYGESGERHQMREIKASGGFHSFDSPVAHFGLDAFEAVKRVEVHWSTGEKTTLSRDFSANNSYTIYRQASGDQ